MILIETAVFRLDARLGLLEICAFVAAVQT